MTPHRRDLAPRRAIRACAAGPAIGMSLLLTTVITVIAITMATAVTWAEPPLRQPVPRGGQPISGPPSTETVSLAVSTELVAKLTAPYHVAVNAQPLRELLIQIAAAGDFNLWLDRTLDLDQEVSLAAGPKTVFSAIAQLAQAAGAEAVAAHNLVLVGRPERLEPLVGAIFASARKSGAQSRTEISWPEATTPSEALRLASRGHGDRGSKRLEDLSLPHDLWPSTRWRGIDADLATLLVTAQFGLMIALGERTETRDGPTRTLRQIAPSPEPSVTDVAAALSTVGDSHRTGRMKLVPLSAPPILTVVYPDGPYRETLRSAAAQADGRSILRDQRPGGRGGAASPKGKLVELDAAPAAHVAAIHAMLSHLSPRAQQAVDLDTVRFTLRLRGAAARDVLGQLAVAAGRTVHIAEPATRAAGTLITLAGEDQTLRQLVDSVTDQAGLQATWNDESLMINLKP